MIVFRLAVIVLLCMTEIRAGESWRSSLYPTDWKPGYADAQGRFLHDFSHAGYGHGEKEIPRLAGPVLDVTAEPYLADKSGQTDATSAIQGALDAAEKAGGGVVLLPAGTYRIAPPRGSEVALRIRGDGVVLRGEGIDRTFLFNDAVEMRGKTVIQVEPVAKADWHAEGGEIPFSPVLEDVPNQSQSARVENPSLFAKGDLVILRGDLTQRFIDSLGMTDKWQPAGAASPNRTLMFCRRIVGVDGGAKRLLFDVPVRYQVTAADLARLVKIPGHMIQGVGLEDFSLGMKQHPGEGLEEMDYAKAGTLAHAVHGSCGIRFEAAEHCWIKRVGTRAPEENKPGIHVLSNMLALSRSRLVTVEECDFKFPQYRGGGGNGYLYMIQGQENLIINCKAEGGRHNYDFGTMRCSGNVISRCLAKDGKLASDFHMFLSMANLLDDITCDGDFLEARAFRPWGGNPVHGVTTTQSVFWNTNGLRYSNEKSPVGRPVLVWSQQLADGYVIGTRGPACEVASDDFVEGVGKGEALEPASLYQDQLARRLKKIQQ